MSYESEALLSWPFKMIDSLILTVRYCPPFANEKMKGMAKGGQGTSSKLYSKAKAIENWKSGVQSLSPGLSQLNTFPSLRNKLNMDHPLQTFVGHHESELLLPPQR